MQNFGFLCGFQIHRSDTRTVVATCGGVQCSSGSASHMPLDKARQDEARAFYVAEGCGAIPGPDIYIVLASVAIGWHSSTISRLHFARN